MSTVPIGRHTNKFICKSCVFVEDLVFFYFAISQQCQANPYSLGQSQASPTAGAWPYQCSICLCGHIGGVSEIQPSLDVSSLRFRSFIISTETSKLCSHAAVKCCLIRQFIIIFFLLYIFFATVSI